MRARGARAKRGRHAGPGRRKSIAGAPDPPSRAALAALSQAPRAIEGAQRAHLLRFLANRATDQDEMRARGRFPPELARGASAIEEMVSAANSSGSAGFDRPRGH